MKGKTTRMQQLRFLTFFHQGFGAKAVCSDTTKSQVKSEDLVQANMEALSGLEKSFFFPHILNGKAGQDTTQVPH